jgi:Na+/melibiose symporter-like transporter
MKTFLFHILRTFRFVFVNGAKLLSALLTLGVVIAIFSDDSPGAGAVFAWAIMAVVLGMFAWYYDSLLRKLEPKKTQNQEWS